MKALLQKVIEEYTDLGIGQQNNERGIQQCRWPAASGERERRPWREKLSGMAKDSRKTGGILPAFEPGAETACPSHPKPAATNCGVQVIYGTLDCKAEIPRHYDDKSPPT